MITLDVKIPRESTAENSGTKYRDLRMPASRLLRLLMHLIFERLKGATFQTELLVMTLLGLANCTLNWCPFDWTSQAEKIQKLPMTSKYSEGIKTVLRWVIITRIIIDHMYFASYLGNFYSVLTWCRPKILLPWMIVSAFKNFLLEFIPFVVTLLLYLEGNFPSILLVEFIVERAITFAPAAYYWCGIKKLYVELSQIQQRKLTRANLMTHSNFNATRFDTTFTDNFNNKRKIFMSLTNFDELSFHSSFELDEDREQYRLTKSLTTLTTMDSQVSVEPEEGLTLSNIESTSLTPAEKAMIILGINQDDVNEARIRLGKNVSTNLLEEEETEDQSTKVHSTDLSIFIHNVNEKLRRNKGSTQENTKPKDEGQSHMNFGKTIDMSSTQSPSKGFTKDRNTLQRYLEEAPQKFSKRCICFKSNDETVNVKINEIKKISLIKIPGEIRNNGEDKNDNDSSENQDLRQTETLPAMSSNKSVNNELKRFGPSVFWSIDFPRSNLYKNADFSTKFYNEDIEISKASTFSTLRVSPTSLQSLYTPNFSKEDVEYLHSTSEYPKRVSVEQLRANEISLEQQKPSEDNTDISNNEITHGSFKDLQQQHSHPKLDDNSSVESKQCIENTKNVTSFRNSFQVDIQADFDYNSDKKWRINQDITEDDFFTNTSRTSTSTQTNVNDIPKKILMNVNKPLQAVINQRSFETVDLSTSKPLDLLTYRRKILPSAITRITKMRKRAETIEEREARELRALRAYNRLTLLEDKREMEMKKRNSAFRNSTKLQGLFSPANLVNIDKRNVREIPKAEPKRSLENEKVQTKLDQISKRQVRSRPQEKTSKLSTFNLGLDTLENFISLSFSSENKNRSKIHHAQNNVNNILPNSRQDGRKQLSKYSKPKRFFNEMKVSSPSPSRIEGLQTGRELDRTRGLENITHWNTIREIDHDVEFHNQNRLPESFSGTILSSLESFQIQQPNSLGINNFNDRVEFHDKYGTSSLKEVIKNIDWGFNDQNLCSNNIVQRENSATSHENVLYDIIDDTDTISLLQSAFASNPGNTERGFYLGPGSTELYSISNYLEDVVEDIMKTASFRSNPDTFMAESTTEVDYGDCYFQELEITKLLTTVNSDDETLTDSNSDTEKSDDKGIEKVKSITDVKLVPSEPIEMCWSSYSREGIDSRINNQRSIIFADLVNERTENPFDPEIYRDRLTMINQDGGKSIAKLLGEQEISYVEYWAKELKDLALNDRRDSFEFTKEFRHLTRLPGFCVIKMLVDFFRDFVSVSRSTMTSRLFVGGNAGGTSSSEESEEFISGYSNQLSNMSTVNESPTVLNNLESFQVVESHVSDTLQALIDRLMDSTDTSNPPSDPVSESHDDRSIFPLREDQFYFGTPKNRFIKKIVTSKPEVQNNDINMQKRVTDSEEIDRETVPQEIVTFYILGVTQNSSRSREQVSVLPENANAPFKVTSIADSFDSLYSIGTAGNFKSSNDVISIDVGSSFEEFPEDSSHDLP